MKRSHCGISCKIKNTDINLSKDLKNKSQQHKLLLLMHLNYLGNVLAKHIMGCEHPTRVKPALRLGSPKERGRGELRPAHIWRQLSQATVPGQHKENNPQLPRRSAYALEAQSTSVSACQPAATAE